MSKCLSTAAIAAFFVLSAGAVSAQSPSTAKPDGAGPGYRLPTADGRCAVWLRGDAPSPDNAPPPANEEVTWSGACKGGWAEGFGLLTLNVDGKLNVQFVGQLRQGRWQGLGRLHLHDEDGLAAIHEGLFKDDQMEGVIKQLFVIDHPGNEEAVAQIRKQRVGREVGDDYLQVRQLFKDGKLEVLCTSPYDCDEQILKLGHKLPVPDAADPLSATLPYGGWRATITSENTGADRKTVEAKPVTMGMCMEQDKVKPGKEARHGALLFPQMETWQPYLRADYYCEDDHVEIKNLALDWRSTCTSPDGSETVRIRQKRQITDKELSSETRVVVRKGNLQTAQAVRRSKMEFVGACTDDMVRAGSLNF